MKHEGIRKKSTDGALYELKLARVYVAINQTASDQCLSSPAGAVALTSQQIVRGYIQQVYGYLCASLRPAAMGFLTLLQASKSCS